MGFACVLGTAESVPSRFVLGNDRSVYVNGYSPLTVTHLASVKIDFLTSFDVAIPLLGLHNDSQGSHAIVHALLQYAAQNTGHRASEDINPLTDVLQQLESAGVNPHAMQYLREFFNTAQTAFNRR